MYEKLIKSLRVEPFEVESVGLAKTMNEAADAIEELSAKVDSLQFFADSISEFPDCNTCVKKNLCEFRPGYGEYCRINCPTWLGVQEPPEEGE